MRSVSMVIDSVDHTHKQMFYRLCEDFGCCRKPTSSSSNSEGN